MQNINLLTAVIAAGAILFVLVRQFTTQALNPRRLAAFPAVFLFLGLRGFTAADLAGAGLAFVVINLSVAGGLGVARAMTFKVWHTAGVTYTRGNWLTLAAWIGSIAVRVVETVIAQHAGLASSQSEIFLFAAMTFGVQGLIIWMRGQSMATVPARI